MSARQQGRNAMKTKQAATKQRCDETRVVIPQDVLNAYRDGLDSAILLLDTVSDEAFGNGRAGIDPSSMLDGAIAIVELIMADIGDWAKSEDHTLKSLERS